jgi:hypothetical protein
LVSGSPTERDDDAHACASKQYAETRPRRVLKP